MTVLAKVLIALAILVILGLLIVYFAYTRKRYVLETILWNESLEQWEVFLSLKSDKRRLYKVTTKERAPVVQDWIVNLEQNKWFYLHEDCYWSAVQITIIANELYDDHFYFGTKNKK